MLILYVAMQDGNPVTRKTPGNDAAAAAAAKEALEADLARIAADQAEKESGAPLPITHPNYLPPSKRQGGKVAQDSTVMRSSAAGQQVGGWWGGWPAGLQLC